MTGHIVFLNGTSSSGKSAIAGRLQNLGTPPYLATGFDHAIQSLPFSINSMTSEGDPPAEFDWAQCVLSRTEPGISELRLGPLARATIAAMHRYAGDLARNGVNVILDDLLVDEEICRQTVDALVGVDVWFVGVRCPLAITVEREVARGDRMVGLARSHFETIHAHGPYDVEVDSSTHTAEEAARVILADVTSGRRPHGIEAHA
jgi:chloramphenicol 3-O phosphotransferase